MDWRGRGAAMGAWVLGACAMAACTPNTAGGGGAGFNGLNQDDTADDDGSAGPGTTGSTSQGSADGTGGGPAGDPSEGATADPPPPPPDTTGDPTAGSSSTGEDVPPTQQEVLERADFGGCNEPLWCFQGNVFNPAGGSMWMQECFTATLPPPFELVELEVVVRGLSNAVGNVDLEVYAYGGATGPGVLLGSRELNADSLAIGTNTIAVEPPIPITQSNVCIGLAAPDPGLAGSLGVSVNPSSQLSNASFFRLQGGPGCNFPGWTDVVDANPIPTGNWCIRGTIREL